MAASSTFEWVSEELERTSTLGRLEARGTLRLILKKAGLDPATVTPKQMEVVLRQLLPGELESRGVDDGRDASERLVRGLSAAGLAGSETSGDSPESVFQRLGGS